jgi:hypothetical protein
MRGSGKSGLSQSNFTRFLLPINIFLLNCQVARNKKRQKRHPWQMSFLFEIVFSFMFTLPVMERSPRLKLPALV